MKQEDANKTVCCGVILEGYERIYSGTDTAVPITCRKRKGHASVHSDPSDGRYIDWRDSKAIAWEGTLKPFRMKNAEVVQAALSDLIVNLDDAAEYALILVENGHKEFQEIYDEIAKQRRIAKNL